MISTFDGTEASNWVNHRKKLENIIWMFELEKKEAIKMIRLSFGADSLHLTDNVSVERYLGDNMSDNPVNNYLNDLEQLFIETFQGKELTRVRFSTAKQKENARRRRRARIKSNG